MILLGSAVNGIAIVIGAAVGLLTGKILPERIRTALVPAMSLVTIGISLNMMGATKLRVLNMVPALIMPMILCQFML